MYLMPLTVVKVLNSSPVKQAALSDTIVSEIPNWENTVLKCSIAAVADDELVHTASIHLEYASIRTKKVLPKNGPAKSMWIRVHGCEATPKDGVVQLVELTWHREQ